MMTTMTTTMTTMTMMIDENKYEGFSLGLPALSG
jgi:hypothetical protein